MEIELSSLQVSRNFLSQDNFMAILTTVPAPLKAAASIKEKYSLHHGAFHYILSIFTIRNWPNLEKTYQINAILVGAAAIQEGL